MLAALGLTRDRAKSKKLTSPDVEKSAGPRGRIRSIAMVAVTLAATVLSLPLSAQENAPGRVIMPIGGNGISDQLLSLEDFTYASAIIGSEAVKVPAQGAPGTAVTEAGTAVTEDRLMTTYVATLGPEDYFNSSEVRLSSLAHIIAQDRANFYRYNVRHESDSSDPIFSEQELRSFLSESPVTICCSLEEYILNGYDRGYAPVVTVSVFGTGQRISRVFLEVTAEPDFGPYKSTN